VRNLVGIAGKAAPAHIVACIGPKTAETAAGRPARGRSAETAAVGPLVDALAERAARLRAGVRCPAAQEEPAPLTRNAAMPVSPRIVRPAEVDPALRRLVAQTSLEPRHLVLPMFVADGIAGPARSASMPGVVQHTRDSLRQAAARPSTPVSAG
jgi:hypothetical protein